MINFRNGWIFIAFLMIIGCGKTDDGLQEISGTVTFGGAPLDSGSIQFVSEDPKISGGGAMIKAGKYLIPKEQGLKPGTYKVLITSGEPGTTAEQAPGAAPVAKERIPAEYNEKSDKKVEVKSGTKNQFDFTIQ